MATKLLLENERFQDSIAVVMAPLCEYPKNHKIVHFHRVSSKAREFYLNEAIKKVTTKKDDTGSHGLSPDKPACVQSLTDNHARPG